jgi:hypothetical protein
MESISHRNIAEQQFKTWMSKIESSIKATTHGLLQIIKEIINNQRIVHQNCNFLTIGQLLTIFLSHFDCNNFSVLFIS